MTKRNLTVEEKKVMHSIAYGADVWGLYEAGICRDIERDFPLLITITKAMNAPEDGAKQQPYFGAILTPVGRKTIGLKERGMNKRGMRDYYTERIEPGEYLVFHKRLVEPIKIVSRDFEIGEYGRIIQRWFLRSADDEDTFGDYNEGYSTKREAMLVARTILARRGRERS